MASAVPFQNIYSVRKVAETNSKPCFICYKPTTVYLVTTCQKDFFPVCLGHLSDRGFAAVNAPSEPSAEELKKKRQEALEKEIEKVKAEYEEKQRRKKEKEKEKEDTNKKKEDRAENHGEEEKEEQKALEKESSPKEIEKAEPPTTYSLHRDFYNIRLQRLRQQQSARRNRELLKSPAAFPPVPKGPIG